MIKLVFAGLKACRRCRRPIAFLMTDNGELTLGIALDACKAQELARRCEEPTKEKFLTDFWLKLIASSPHVIREIVLDTSEEGPIFARVDVTTEVFCCAPQEAVGLAAAAGLPLYATERALEQVHLFHPSDTEGESSNVIQPKLKPTLH
ncbi:MAG TPA: bifunctional nuclease domain-containing protein [Candidatus Binatia bacterium]|nr:bifunctional nuclease domain-containing protein [Candidatus Binatia bacterium]